jgi:hypothetical protein
MIRHIFGAHRWRAASPVVTSPHTDRHRARSGWRRGRTRGRRVRLRGAAAVPRPAPRPGIVAVRASPGFKQRPGRPSRRVPVHERVTEDPPRREQIVVGTGDPDVTHSGRASEGHRPDVIELQSVGRAAEFAVLQPELAPAAVAEPDLPLHVGGDESGVPRLEPWLVVLGASVSVVWRRWCRWRRLLAHVSFATGLLPAHDA